MDEILIDEKKYISSKQAAKLTGYAKDYVGQLCREGRVPARLVGRSWYVLESAIQDHRFSTPKEALPQEEKLVLPQKQPLESTWDAPRYVAPESDVLPVENATDAVHDGDDATELPQRVQESWEAWFSRFDTPVKEKVENIEDTGEVKNEPKEASMDPISPPVPQEAQPEAEIHKEEVSIPLHTLYEPQQAPPEELLPRPALLRGSLTREGRRKSLPITSLLKTFGAVFALVLAGLAVCGSGYIDSFIISSNQDNIIAGVSIYNK